MFRNARQDSNLRFLGKGQAQNRSEHAPVGYVPCVSSGPSTFRPPFRSSAAPRDRTSHARGRRIYSPVGRRCPVRCVTVSRTPTGHQGHPGSPSRDGELLPGLRALLQVLWLRRVPGGVLIGDAACVAHDGEEAHRHGSPCRFAFRSRLPQPHHVDHGSGLRKPTQALFWGPFSSVKNAGLTPVSVEVYSEVMPSKDDSDLLLPAVDRILDEVEREARTSVEEHKYNRPVWSSDEILQLCTRIRKLEGWLAELADVVFKHFPDLRIGGEFGGLAASLDRELTRLLAKNEKSG